MRDARRLLVGVLGAPHGVRGEMRLTSYTGEPEAIRRYRPLWSEDGRFFSITALRPIKGGLFVARLDGVADRTVAEGLVNTKLYVDRDALPAADEDEFYHADLVGLAAVDLDGVALGTLVAVRNFGAGDLVEIAPAHGDSWLVPFTRAVVPVIDVAGGRIVVAPPTMEPSEDGA